MNKKFVGRKYKKQKTFTQSFEATLNLQRGRPADVLHMTRPIARQYASARVSMFHSASNPTFVQ